MPAEKVLKKRATSKTMITYSEDSRRIGNAMGEGLVAYQPDFIGSRSTQLLPVFKQ